MTDLVTFLRARLDEDETAAKVAPSQTVPADHVGAAASGIPVMPVACFQDVRICRDWRMKSGSAAVRDTRAPSRTRSPVFVVPQRSTRPRSGTG